MQGAGVSDNTSSGGDRLLTSSGGNRALTSSGGDRMFTPSLTRGRSQLLVSCRGVAGAANPLRDCSSSRVFRPDCGLLPLRIRGPEPLLGAGLQAPAALEGDGMVKVERSPPSGALGVLGELTRTLTTKLTAKLTFADESEDGFGTRMFDMSGAPAWQGAHDSGTRLCDMCGAVVRQLGRAAAGRRPLWLHPCWAAWLQAPSAASWG
jgi:hypothetical protein